MAHIGHNLVEFCRRQRILERLDMLGPRSAGSGVADAVAQRQAYDQLMARGQCGKQASEFRIVMKRGHEIGTKMSAVGSFVRNRSRETGNASRRSSSAGANSICRISSGIGPVASHASHSHSSVSRTGIRL